MVCASTALSGRFLVLRAYVAGGIRLTPAQKPLRRGSRCVGVKLNDSGYLTPAQGGLRRGALRNVRKLSSPLFWRVRLEGSPTLSDV